MRALPFSKQRVLTLSRGGWPCQRAPEPLRDIRFGQRHAHVGTGPGAQRRDSPWLGIETGEAPGARRATTLGWVGG